MSLHDSGRIELQPSREVRPFAPAASPALWKASDLVRRLRSALRAAREVFGILDAAPATQAAANEAARTGIVLRDKVAAETAMLLACVEPVRHVDDALRREFDAVARRLVPHVRHDDLAAGICMDPGHATDLAVAHVIVSRLGYPDPHVDELLALSLALGAQFGPERLPHRRLEQAWLARMSDAFPAHVRLDDRIVAESMLGRPVDALGATRLDLYAFTHALMYASDLGNRALCGARPSAELAGDAEAALAYSLDADDFDLTAEILLTWPMLALPWSAPATFAFRVLCTTQDRLGFLPGASFDAQRHRTLEGPAAAHYAALTSYHTAYVMGFLCALALRPEHAPPVAPASDGDAAAVAALLAMLDVEHPQACWRDSIASLDDDARQGLAPLLLAMVLRRARACADLRRIRAALEIAVAFGITGSPAPVQAAALLRRVHALASRPGN